MRPDSVRPARRSRRCAGRGRCGRLLAGPSEGQSAGETWEHLSLHGDADFHALAAAHGLVYGHDSTSGTFMVTADQEQWDRRSRLPMRAFAVDPADPDGIVATTGLMATTNDHEMQQSVQGHHSPDDQHLRTTTAAAAEARQLPETGVAAGRECPAE